MTRIGAAPSEAELSAVIQMKYGTETQLGWGPRLRKRFQHFTPDDIYETYLTKLVGSQCKWLDVGCGRNLFPDNIRLSKLLAERAGLLVGLDPDPTIDENPYVHQRIRGTIEQVPAQDTFTLLTLRMVAEHIESPDAALKAIASMTSPGGRVVVYTVSRWTPTAILAALLPFRFHHGIKRLLWRTESKDTFPVQYRMNTRKELHRLFGGHGFQEIYFSHLDDCRTFARFRILHFLELCLWRILRSIGLRYPETCLLGVYERIPTSVIR